MVNPKRYLITAALPYANGPKHIGHLAGVYLPADIYTRYLRAQKRDVVFVSGSDEYGAAITMQAMKENTTPKAIVDKYHEMLKSNMADLSISFDIYHRTTAELHTETAQEFFTYLNDRGKLNQQTSEQYYDEDAQTFLADRFIIGTCPVCAYEAAYGDQCEKCGTSLSPEQLMNPKSVITGKSPVLKETTHWYLPLNEYEKFLTEWIFTEHKDDWRSTVLGQCKSWLEMGLHARAVTRDLDWGVPVPVDEAKGKVLYVWFDAPIGYISATKQWAKNTGKNWEPYWKDKDTKLVHFIGKDNIVFHTIIFPVMLKLHDYVLPDNVPSNEFMNLEGQKMSTSRGWSVEMNEYIDDFVKAPNGNIQMVDALRYYLTQIAPETKDSEFMWKGFQEAVNSELVGVFGNFINRVFVLMQKYCNSKVPPFSMNDITDTDKKMLDAIVLSKTNIEPYLEQYRFREALFEVIDLARTGNKYLQDKQPWIVAKNTDASGNITEEAQKSINNTIHVCLQLCANLAIYIHPFLPNTAKKMLYMMKVVDKMLEWENAGRTDLLKTGYTLRAPELLFTKIEDSTIEAQLEKLNQKSKAATAHIQNDLNQLESVMQTDTTPEPLKETIQFDEFSKIDIRVGTIKTAEKVEKADKLLKLTVDIGSEVRTIVSGIATYFQPEQLIDKQVLVVVNLAPRKMRGIESNGMILLAESADGSGLQFVSPEKAVINGSQVS